MLDFADIVPVAPIFAEAGIPLEGRNFEDAYTELALAADKTSLRDAVERVVFDYFASLELPDTPTLYDHLVLSLRPKDVIATFNWDPFLIQVVMRNGHVGGYPRLLFLHGNVLQKREATICPSKQVQRWPPVCRPGPKAVSGLASLEQCMCRSSAPGA